MEEPKTHMSSLSYSMHPSYTSLQAQVPNYMMPHERPWRDYVPEQPPHPELQYGQCPYPPRSLSWQGAPVENGYQITGSFYACSPTDAQPPSAFSLDPGMRSAEAMALTDFRLHISLFYRESLVKEVTTTCPEGCRISSCPEDKLYGAMEQVLFPFPYPQSQRKGVEKLPNVLDRGVLLWLAPDGLYAKRLCQSRIYWEGPLAPYTDRPNKLEKDQPCKLFDTQEFLAELQGFAHHGRPMPRFQVVLCFGDEYPEPQRQKKMITAQVEPMFARHLLYFTQQTSTSYIRGYELPEHGLSPAEDYQRVIHHNGLQE